MYTILMLALLCLVIYLIHITPAFWLVIAVVAVVLLIKDKQRR